MKLLVSSFILGCIMNLLPACAADHQVQDLAIEGGLRDGKARLTIEGWLGSAPDPVQPIVAAVLHDNTFISRTGLTQHIALTLDVVGGSAREVALQVAGNSIIRQVTGNIRDWSLRQDTNGFRNLVLRLPQQGTNREPIRAIILADQREYSIGGPVELLSLNLPKSSLLSGYIQLVPSPDMEAKLEAPGGLIPIDAKHLPEQMRALGSNAPSAMAFRFQGESYRLPLKIDFADPQARQVVLSGFSLRGTVAQEHVSFRLQAMARVTNPQGGRLELLSGLVGLTEAPEAKGWRLYHEGERYFAVFDEPGEYTIQVGFNAPIKQVERQNRLWRALQFSVATAPVSILSIAGLPAEAHLEGSSGSKAQRIGERFETHLPNTGAVDIAWRIAGKQSEGKLFYAVEMLSQVTISPGLIKQAAVLSTRVMQGELDSLPLTLRGVGEVTKVQGAQVLSWSVSPGAKDGERLLVVKFNQPLKESFTLQIQVQAALAAFPTSVEPLRLTPREATRFSGYIRVANEGAVRLEVSRTAGMTQVSPEQFPETESTRAALVASGSHKFVYRFSGSEATLDINADQISPEVSVSQVLTYRVAENELSIEAEFELEIREAPLRELWLDIPRGYVVAGISASGLNDYFARDAQGETQELRLVYSAPVSGRQLVQLRLEQNRGLTGSEWALPRVGVAKTKVTRGHVGVAAEAGLRVSAERVRSLTEVATAYYPKKTQGLQSTFRLTDENWQALMRVERLPQSVQADAMHLFSIGEGIAYGSSVINYNISGAPLGTFLIELSSEFSNVEFSGKDVRAWQRTNDAYLVQLHTPVSGPYSLLVTYERPFKAQGETLAFSGARPVDAQSEQGHTLVISAYQFEVKPTEVSAGLLPLETAEVPQEHRLFFDAPLLAAYRYTARPFSLRLALSPLTQGDSLSQVVDRAAIQTRISKEGQVITDARYFVKNRGNPQFRVSLPPGTDLWAAQVNGGRVVPVLEKGAALVPLPQTPDPNAVLTIDLKMASRAKTPHRLNLAAPVLATPVLLAEWKLVPEAGQRLSYLGGTVKPTAEEQDASGFGQLRRALRGGKGDTALMGAVAGLVFWVLACALWSRAAATGRSGMSQLLHFCVGCTCAVAGLAALVLLGVQLSDEVAPHNGNVTLLAPVQEAASALRVEVANIPSATGVGAVLGAMWPAAIGFALLLYSYVGSNPSWPLTARIAAWVLFAWGCLRLPNGAPVFIGLLGLFLVLHGAVPALKAYSRARRATATRGPSAAGAALALLALSISLTAVSSAAETKEPRPVLADSVQQEVMVEENSARASAKFRWSAKRGDLLPILFDSGVLTGADYPTNGLRLVRIEAGGRLTIHLMAEQDGVYEGKFSYITRVEARDNQPGIILPTGPALVNSVQLTISRSDVRVSSPQAVSIERSMSGSNTVSKLTLSSSAEAWVGWAPRARDLQGEATVFYADVAQVYAPMAGVVEGAHVVSLRPAQGEISELRFVVPKGATVTDVQPVASPALQQNNQTAPGVQISMWRFDPDASELRVRIAPAQSKAFALAIRSQVLAAPLPFKQELGILKMLDAAGQVGYVGVATGSEVQLDEVLARNVAPVNLEDFPVEPTRLLLERTPGATLRRGFRYTSTDAALTLRASAVEPDVRVEAQQTVSLGEDRVVVALHATVSITRAGVFRLSFPLPAGYEVESVSSPALSHWTEARIEAERLITLHLKGRTEGQQQVSITLSGGGARATNSWAVPVIALREASKHRGTLVLAPEQGLRLQVGQREGLTQLDPQRSGISQKGVLAFRVLQTSWRLLVGVEKVDAWVQVTSLQHVAVSEAQLRISANLQYQVENAGVKQFRFALPTNAESVRVSGDQLADWVEREGDSTNGLRIWEARLQRRVTGPYKLQVRYNIMLPQGDSSARLSGIEALDVQSQRGFVTIESAGRLRLGLDSVPETLQATEWQGLPKHLLSDLRADAANYVYRIVEPRFTLRLNLERREAAKLLPARVNNVHLNTVVADDAASLTQVRIDILPGDKRLLNITLPPGGVFWFALVNQNGVVPWRDKERVLIPLEQQSRGDQPAQVEFFYAAPIGRPGSAKLDLRLLAPKFDLPLENIKWRVMLNEKWKLARWSGSFELERTSYGTRELAADPTVYLRNEAAILQERTREAEQLIVLGNSALQQGDPRQARRAFQSAFGLSRHDAAFNEDARVQLQNVKVQQAMLGLNYRNVLNTAEQAKAADTKAQAQAGYTQQDAKDMLEKNSADENAALRRQAERIIQQQDAAVSSTATLRASLPEQGRALSFTRTVAVDPWADLSLAITARGANAPAAYRFGILLVTTCAIWLVLWLAGRFNRVDAKPLSGNP